MTSLQPELARNRKIVVLGDVMLDVYTFGVADRVSPESPILVVKSTTREVRPGGAANTAANCRALGAHVTICGIIGDDHDGRTLENLLCEQGVDVRLVRDARCTTTVKERILGRSPGRSWQQMLRIDTEGMPDMEGCEAAVLQEINEALVGSHALLISDYGKGVCTAEVLSGAIARAQTLGVPVYVDPARGVEWRRYRGASLIKPNRRETTNVLESDLSTTEEISAKAGELIALAGGAVVLVTLDRDGMVLIQSPTSITHFPAVPRDIVDVSGAGDTALAVVAVAAATGVALTDAVRLANLAAGIQVTRIGATSVTWDEIRDCGETELAPRKIVDMRTLRERCREFRRQGKRLVFTNGCFDLLHVGHISYLQQAARLGEVLIVAINDDQSVRALKGEERPVNGEQDRAQMLAALSVVDLVTIFSRETPCELLHELRPDILVKGGDYTLAEVVGREIVESYGGRVVVAPKVHDISTSRLLSVRRGET